MRSLLVLIILPVMTFAQQNYSNWLTPFATVDFKEKEILFRVAETSPACELIPVALLSGEFVVSREPSIHFKSAEIYQGIRQLGAYLENPDQPGGKYNDYLRYIKAFALQSFLALSGHGMPSTAVYDKVSNMSASPDREIARISGMALRLYRHVQNYLNEQYGSLDYLSSTMLPEPELDLFSLNRIMNIPDKKEPEQNTDSIVWPRYYGKEESYASSEDIIETYDHGYFISGNYNTYEGTIYKAWSWLIKTNLNGIKIWEKIIEGGDFAVKNNAVEETDDGGILCCGRIWSAVGLYEPYVMKLNSCGEKEWCKVFTGSVKENPWAEDILETANGQIYILVNQWGTGTIEDMYIFKLSSGGEVLWKKSYCNAINHPESNIAVGESIIETSINKIMIAGRVYWADPWNPGGPKPIRSFFVSMDSLGNEEWVMPFGLEDSIHGNGTNVIEVNKNSYIGLATKWPTSTLQSVLINFDSSGNVLNYIIIENDEINPEITRGVPLNIERIDSVYILGGIYGDPNDGYSSEIILDTNIFSNFNVKGFLQRVNEEQPYTMIKAGNKYLTSSTYTNSEDWKIVLSKINLNLEYDTLTSGNYTYDSLCTTPGLPQSGFIYLDECDIITGEEIPSPEEYYTSIATIPITAYPNPAEKEITLTFENTDHHSNMLLECYNIYGQKVHSEKIWKGQQQTRLDVSEWSNGLYFAVVKSNGKVAGTGRFVRR